MNPTIYALLCILLFFLCIYYMYGGMVSSLVRWSKPAKADKHGKLRQPTLTTAESLKCYIPFYQVLYMRRALYRSYGAWLYVAIISAVCITVRIFNMIVPINGNVMFITIFMMYFGVILHILLYAIPTAAVAKMYGYGWVTVIITAIVPHFAAYFLKGGISCRMAAMKKEEVFNGNNGETYIKSRTDERQSGHAVSARRNT